MENIVADLKTEDNTVDYAMKINYEDATGRPCSFEPIIKENGNLYESLPDNLKIIENKKNIVKIAKENITEANHEGLKSGMAAAGITLAVSTVDNVSQFLDGEITAEDMAFDIAKDTAVAGVAGYGTTFVTSSVSQVLSKSSNELIKRVGGGTLPGAAVSFAVESFDDIEAYAKDEIDGYELACNLGENAVQIAGSTAAGVAAAAVLGTGGVAAVGGIAAGVIGCALATEMYETALEVAADGPEVLAYKAEELANNTVDLVTETVPDQIDNVKGAFNDFFSNTSLKIQL